MKVRHLLTTVGLAVTMLSSGAAYAQTKMTIGFSQVGSESGWRAAETKVSKIEAEKRGVDLKISDAQQKQENQIRAVRSFIAQGVDAIFVAPVVSTGWDTVLKEAKDAKIPVVLLDRSIETKDPSLYLTAVTSDTVNEGKVAAECWRKKPAASAMWSSCRARSDRARQSTERRASIKSSLPIRA